MSPQKYSNESVHHVVHHLHNESINEDDQMVSKSQSPKTHDQRKYYSKTGRSNGEEAAIILQGPSSQTTQVDGGTNSSPPLLVEEDTGRERLKRHRVEVAGRVWIPDLWGQEELLKDWIDCSVFDASLGNNNIMSARAALVEEGRRANSRGLRIENRC
uniref:Protein BIC1 n=1 Tax=Davidia involucrata TaxID=16924 RepID=A0A5B7BNC6_DAVIN